MPGAPLNNAPQQETLEGREQGQCRICLEYAGDLIAPCLCKGSGKWVHRHCLDHWRARGEGSRTFTHCPNCHFGYLMDLMRAPTETEQHLRERRRAVLRQAAAHFLLGVLMLQVLLCTVAVLIRSLDRDEELVEIMPFWSPVRPGVRESKCSFLQAFRYHKTTYYFASVVFCLAMTGLGVIIHYTAKLCAKCCARREVVSDADNSGSSSDITDGESACGRAGRGDGRQCNCNCSDIYRDTCCWPSPVYPFYRGGYDGYEHSRLQDCCNECNICCRDCCDSCRREPCCDSCPTFLSGESSSDDNNGVLAVVFFVILVFLVFIGLFFAMAALVAWMQKVAQRYLALKELKVLTGEYIVKDLSELEKQYSLYSNGQDLEQGNVEPSAPAHRATMWVPMMPQEVQTNLYRDLQAVYGMESR